MNGKIVIIGGGIAGVQAAASLADKWDVFLVLGENYLPYYRMRIEEIISGSSPESLYIHPESWYGEKGIKLCHSPASSIDGDGRIVKSEIKTTSRRKRKTFGNGSGGCFGQRRRRL